MNRMNIGIRGNRDVCKFNLRGICRFGNRCWNLHETPEIVEPKIFIESKEEDGARALSPTRPKEPLREVYGPSTSSAEAAITLVKISESEEKVCGICFDTILKKVERSEQTFGILPNCNHCFCFACIRKWRQSKEFDFDVSKACPECRIASDYVYPSKVWLETKEEKLNFIDSHRKRMKTQDCKYFRKGKGKCPFGNTCLYLHSLANGLVVDVGPPSPRRHGLDSVVERESEILQQLLYWINDDDDVLESDFEDDFDLDLDDPLIAVQYYDKDDLEYYVAMNRLMNGSDSEDDDNPFHAFLD